MIAAPEFIGEYLVRREIGEGGQGRVYLATDARHHRDVAIKLFSEASSDPTVRRAIEREVKLMGKFDTHPSIVRLHDSGMFNGRQFLVLAYYRNGSVLDRLNREGEMPYGDVLRCARDIGNALRSVHQVDAVHRDVKPHNIFVSDQGYALGDFGIAGLVNDNTISGASDAWCPPYAAPEVHRDCEPTAGSDMYSLGVSLYHMLAGRRPFEGTGHQLQERILAGYAAPIGRADVPPEFEDLVLRLMSLHPADRFTADRFVRRLDTLRGAVTDERRATMPALVLAPAASASASTVVKVKRVGKPLLAAGLAATIAAVAGGGAHLSNRREAVASSPATSTEFDIGPGTDGAPPESPSNVRVERVENTVRATWSPIAGAAKYVVSWSDGELEGSDTVTVPEFELRLGAPDGPLICVTVSAVNEAGSPSWAIEQCESAT